MKVVTGLLSFVIVLSGLTSIANAQTATTQPSAANTPAAAKQPPVWGPGGFIPTQNSFVAFMSRGNDAYICVASNVTDKTHLPGNTSCVKVD
jgi:hypothetical protein